MDHSKTSAAEMASAYMASHGDSLHTSQCQATSSYQLFCKVSHHNMSSASLSVLLYFAEWREEAMVLVRRQRQPGPTWAQMATITPLSSRQAALEHIAAE